MITRRAFAGFAVALAVACGAAAAAERGTKHEVTMRGNSFGPRRLDVARGDTIVWINRDIVRHDASAPGSFDSGELRAGERYEWVAADTGVIRYRCTIHQRMRGEIRVTETR